MRIKPVIALFVLFQCFISSNAQNGTEYNTLLNEISANNLTLAAARKQLSADQLENQSATRLANPEVDYGYQWGSPEEVANRHVVTVMQPFDFSLLSGNRRRVAAAGNNVLDAEYQASCIAVLIEASEYYADACLYRQLDSLYSKRVSLTEHIAKNAARELETGEADQLHYNKSQLLLANIKTEAAYNHIAFQEAVDALRQLNGGKVVTVSFDEPVLLPLPSDFEEWYAASTENIPDARLAALGVDLCREQLSESRTDAIPELAVGYSGEIATGANYHGFQVGLSIPLWSSGLKVKQAKARLESATLQKEDAMMKLHNTLKTAYDRAQTLLQVYRSSEEMLRNLHYSQSIEHSLSEGEISLLDYSVEMEYLFDAVDDCQTALCDYNKAAATLLLLMGNCKILAL